jgi:hypothetical protein
MIPELRFMNTWVKSDLVTSNSPDLTMYTNSDVLPSCSKQKSLL